MIDAYYLSGKRHTQTLCSWTFGQGPCKFPVSGVLSSFTGRIEKSSICLPLISEQTSLPSFRSSRYNSFIQDSPPNPNPAPPSWNACLTVSCYLTSKITCNDSHGNSMKSQLLTVHRTVITTQSLSVCLTFDYNSSKPQQQPHTRCHKIPECLLFLALVFLLG